MISKARIKLIHALERKKIRDREGLFVAEGPKLVDELLGSMPLYYVAATENWLKQYSEVLHNVESDTVTPDELQRISLLQHPQDVVALFAIPHFETHIGAIAIRELILTLDGVQDPGNLGTIVRLADWFGIRHIFCSPDCADIYSPKATQATMGALARVEVHYVDIIYELRSLCEERGKGPSLSIGEEKGSAIPIYGTFLNGDNIYSQPLTQNGVIVMGNEGRGISPAVEQFVNRRLYIPPYPNGRQTVESLNVAVATAIVCSEFRRPRG